MIASDLEPLGKVVRALRAPNRRQHFVYEAGPCGFGIHRYLTKHGEDCVVVSPSMVPKRSGDRVKTDRRDSVTLVRHRWLADLSFPSSAQHITLQEYRDTIDETGGWTASPSSSGNSRPRGGGRPSSPRFRPYGECRSSPP